MSALGRTKLYRTWCRVLSRCFNQDDPSWPYYGERGITVCCRWLESFAHFAQDMGQPPTRKHTLERVDNDGPYAPGNCRWATWKEQAQNRRTSRRIQLGEETLTMAQWADRLGVDRRVLWKRLAKGWPVSRALTTAGRGHPRRVAQAA